MTGKERLIFSDFHTSCPSSYTGTKDRGQEGKKRKTRRKEKSKLGKGKASTLKSHHSLLPSHTNLVSKSSLFPKGRMRVSLTKVQGQLCA